MTTATANQLTPLVKYLIRGDSLIVPIEITQSIKVPIWNAASSILEDEYVRGTLIADYYFQCTIAGITGATEPVWASYSNIGDTVMDGTVEWTNMGKLFLTSEADIAKQPINIAGWKLYMTVKSDLADSDADAQAAFDYVFLNSASTMIGRDTVIIPASKMIELIPGNAYMDMQIKIPYATEDIIITFGLGKIKVYADSSERITP